MADKFLRNLLS